MCGSLLSSTMAISLPNLPATFLASLPLHCFPHLWLQHQTSCYIALPCSFATISQEQFPGTFIFLNTTVQFKSTLSESKASGFHILSCPGRTTMPMELRELGEMGWDESIPRLKCHKLLLFLPKVQVFIFNKCLSDCCVPLVNFQSPKMVVLENSVHFHHWFLDIRIAKLLTLPFFSLTSSVHLSSISFFFCFLGWVISVDLS